MLGQHFYIKKPHFHELPEQHFMYFPHYIVIFSIILKLETFLHQFNGFTCPAIIFKCSVALECF